MSQSLINIDDEYVGAELAGDGYIDVSVVTPDQLAEEILLADGIKNALESDINKITQQAYNEIKTEFQRNIKSTVLSSLGFEKDSWGSNGWKVDHCNGRSSVITDLLSAKVKALFKSEVDPLISELMPSIIDAVKADINKEFKNAFLTQVRREARKAAEIAAHEFVKELMEVETEKLRDEAILKVKETLLGIKNKGKGV